MNRTDVSGRLQALPARSMMSALLLALLTFSGVACDSKSTFHADSTATTAVNPSNGPAQETPTATQAMDSATTPLATGRVTLNAVGDLMLARDIVTMMDEWGSAYPFAAVKELLADADITIANIEGTFTERGTQASKFYTFRSPPHHSRGLAEAGIDVVSLGNNHAMDFGAQGLQDTLDALDAAGVLHSGAGANAEAARAPVFMERNGLSLAFLSYNGVSEATFAGPNSYGVASADTAAISQDVAGAKASADMVIVSLHAGTEYTDTPTAQQSTLARAAIDAGAVLVLGHHAHVLQGMQEYNGGLIVYGLGNFVFDLDSGDLATLGPRPFQTMVLRLELSHQGVEKVATRPVFIDPAENRPMVATGERLREIETRIERLSAALR
jgi:poly-gamma-glutamate capsule biosynthesis protein CapA/YwtB (metallophosphatase superfamily)